MAEAEALVRALRRLDKATKRHSTVMPEAVRILKAQLQDDKENHTPQDMEVCAKVITEYVDALDFMITMWNRLKSMTATRTWEVHASLLTQTGFLFD